MAERGFCDDAPDEHASARARLEARKARLHEEEGHSPRGVRRPSFAERPRREPREGSGHGLEGTEGAHPSRSGRTERTATGRSLRSAHSSSPSRSAQASGASGFARALSGIFETVRDVAAGLISRGNPRIALIAGGVVVLIIVALVITSAVRGCSASEPAQDPATVPQQASGPIEVTVPDTIDAEVAAQLKEAGAAGNVDVAWIGNHTDDYAIDGEMVQYKLLKLAVNEPEAVPFVRGFPERYPSDAGEPSGGEQRQGGAPLLYQWDQRWGYTVYSSTTFALTGCCPTSLAIVYQGVTGKSDLTPYDMGRRANEGGYETEYDGTDATFLVEAAPGLGLTCEPLDITADAVTGALSGGAVIICNVGPGDFTTEGHFIVLSGLADDGTLLVNDPFSAERSKRTWDIETVLGQTTALWAYRAA